MGSKGIDNLRKWSTGKYIHEMADRKSFPTYQYFSARCFMINVSKVAKIKQWIQVWNGWDYYKSKGVDVNSIRMSDIFIDEFFISFNDMKIYFAEPWQQACIGDPKIKVKNGSHFHSCIRHPKNVGFILFSLLYSFKTLEKEKVFLRLLAQTNLW